MVERALIEVVAKPWGSENLLPWNNASTGNGPVGELLFHRPNRIAPKPALLLKILFTEQRLSIQVHPDDAFAVATGLPNGKTEAWYVLSARPGAKVAVGLERETTVDGLRAAISEGSVPELIHWRDVSAGDVISVPAGTIHAIGPGLVIAEIQQNSDATFRLFDFGRQRELHIDDALAVAHLGPLAPQATPIVHDKVRSTLLVNPHFVLERLDLAAGTSWKLSTPREAWLMPISGNLRVGALALDIGEAAYADSGETQLSAGDAGGVLLVAYVGPNVLDDLLRPVGRQIRAGKLEDVR